MNHDELLKELIIFCEYYEAGSKTEMLLAGDANEHLDMQYYLGRKHAAHDIIREVYRLQSKLKAQQSKDDNQNN